MSHEVHVTRGPGFGQAGADPITAEQWHAAVTAHPEIAIKEGSAFGRLAGRPIIFNGGLISSMSPSAAAMPTLYALASELGARVFGEDGAQLGQDARSAIRDVLATAFPGLDAAPIDETLARHLIIVSGAEPIGEPAVAKKAVVECSGLQGAAADVALAYLACRAVESSGEPSAMSTCVAANLQPRAPKRLSTFTKAPTTAWVAEVERLAAAIAKRPGAYVIRKCHGCGAANRVALFPPDGRRATCGRCKTALAPLDL